MKKIKQIAKIFLTKKLTEVQSFEKKLTENNLIQSFKKLDTSYYEIILENNAKLIIRNHRHSDYKVFRQIFNEKEYEGILKIMLLNDDFKGKKNIIDAGANVGYTTTFFSLFLNDVSIFAIEPSEKNMQILEKNISFLENKKSIKLYQNALSDKENQFFEIENNFRDGSDWSIATKEVEISKLKGITLNQIIKQNSLEYISLLKIDIEGAERFIFKNENDLSFLSKTQIIAIEIHDEFNIRDSIYNILKVNNFILLESGELTIGLNKNLL